MCIYILALVVFFKTKMEIFNDPKLHHIQCLDHIIGADPVGIILDYLSGTRKDMLDVTAWEFQNYEAVCNSALVVRTSHKHIPAMTKSHINQLIHKYIPNKKRGLKGVEEQVGEMCDIIINCDESIKVMLCAPRRSHKSTGIAAFLISLAVMPDCEYTIRLLTTGDRATGYLVNMVTQHESIGDKLLKLNHETIRFANGLVVYINPSCKHTRRSQSSYTLSIIDDSMSMSASDVEGPVLLVCTPWDDMSRVLDNPSDSIDVLCGSWGDFVRSGLAEMPNVVDSMLIEE